MEIVWLGHSSFRLRGRQATVVTDPYDAKMVGLKFPKTTADIVTVSHDHNDHNQAQLVEGAKVVSGPGEYEIKGVSILGLSTFHDERAGSERGANTVFVITLDGARIAHLGDLGHKLSEEHLGQIGAIDILLIPVGGFFTIDAKTAAGEVARLEPKVVIPMHYQIPGLNPAVFAKLAAVGEFVREVGINPRREVKYTLAAEDLASEETKLILLEKR